MNSVEFLSNYAGGTIYGLHFKVKLDFNQSTAGKTVVTWTSYFMLDEANASNYSAAAELFLEITPIKGTTSATRIEAIPWKENDGFYSFSSLDDKPFKSGTFTITHTENGEGSFGFVLNGNIGGYKKPFVYKDCGTITLDTNIPYSKCGAPTKIKIDKTVQKPGGNITFSWSGQTPGESNPIKSYNIRYKIGANGSWISGSSTTNSKTFTIPSSATSSRGQSLFVQVQTIGSISGYDSSYSGQKELGKINSLPTIPNVTVNRTTVPYNNGKGGEVIFTFSGSTDQDNQEIRYAYSTSASGNKTKLGAGVTTFSPTITKNVTYYFWSVDTLDEYCQGYAYKNVSINTKPTVKMSFTGTEFTSNYKVTFSGSNGQSSGNKYTFGYNYGGNSYTLIEESTSTSYTIGDIRGKLGPSQSSPLKAETDYNYTYWAKRKDGLNDESDVVTTSNKSFTTPKITLTNDKNQNSYFSKKVNVKIEGGSGGKYTLASFDNITVNNMELNTQNFEFGKELKILKFSNGFYVQPTTWLTKVKAFDFIPSGGKATPFDNEGNFSVYSTPTLGAAFVGRDSSYGVSKDSSIKIKISNLPGTLEAVNTSTDINTFSYSFIGENLWSTFFKEFHSSQQVYAYFSITNDFGDSFSSKGFPLNLDFSYTPKIDSCSLYILFENEETSLKDWNFLKEGMSINCDLKIFSFRPIKAQIKIQKENSNVWENFGSSFIVATTEPNSDKKDYNATPYAYTISKTVNELNKIQESYKCKFQIELIATDDEAKSMTIFPFNEDYITIKAHVDPSGFFNSVNYNENNKSLTAVLNLNKMDDSTITKIGIKIQNQTDIYGEVNYNSENNTYVWQNFDGKIGTNEFLHLAPALTSKLSAKITIDGQTKEGYTTTKTTTNFQYVAVYNISPTVSYRRNCLGINTKEPTSKENAILVITDYGENNLIYLNSSQRANMPSIINLKTGELSNFYLDGGTW